MAMTESKTTRSTNIFLGSSASIPIIQIPFGNQSRSFKFNALFYSLFVCQSFRLIYCLIQYFLRHLFSYLLIIVRVSRRSKVKSCTQ